MRLVIIESPYAPSFKPALVECCCRPATKPVNVDDLCFGHECESCDIWKLWYAELLRNLSYARAAMRDCLLRGEAPYASHLLYTQDGVLDDTVPEQRKLGMEAGFAYRDAVEASIVYTDLGISKGMQQGIDDANAKGRPVEYRSLTEWTS